MAPALAVLAAAVVASTASATGLVDEPLLGETLQYLDGVAWTVQSTDGSDLSAPAIVPGDLITDLQRGGIVGDPLYELGMLDATWDKHAFRYTLEFDLSPSVVNAWTYAVDALLVFDGIKLASNITLNGQQIGETTNQFLRSVFSVGSMLKFTGNVLTVDFPVTLEDARNDIGYGRFSSCSGGWDWAPYSNYEYGRTPLGINTFSKGIWKSVYVVPVSGAALTGLTALTYYEGPYPTAPLTSGPAGDFHVDVTVRLWAPQQAKGWALQGNLIVTPGWGAGTAVTVPVTLTPGAESSFNVTLHASASDVQLWWPVGLGAQPLYNVSASFVPKTPTFATLTTVRTVGFKVFALVTADDSNPAALQGQDGSGNLTMRYKINGADMFARGANWIPMDEMEGRVTGPAMRAALQAAVDADMNTLRVWGGGVWPHDELLDAADEMGLLLTIDAMFSDQATSYHMASAEPSTEAEIRYQLRRIASHPSIAVWHGCNECGGSGVYESFVSTLLAEEDPSRPVWPSSPSAGWSQGVDRLTGLPNGEPLHTTRASAANSAYAPYTGSCGSAGNNATYVPAAQLHGFPVSQFQVPITTKTAADCCALCASTPNCVAGMFDPTHGACSLEGNPDAPAVFNSIPGFVAVYPSLGLNDVPVVPLPNKNEQHGPYRGGGGMPAVNGGTQVSPFPTGIPPSLAPTQSTYGRSAQGTFTSEFGSTAMSSFESMAPTLAPEHWGIFGGTAPDVCSGGFVHVCNGSNPMAQRNYIAATHVASYFGQSQLVYGLNTTGADAFKAQLYLAQLASALQVKSYVEQHRSENLWGLLTWQLNEIWPTGGWGSIEYGTVGYTSGQVLGGRWKPLHYWFPTSLFTDLFVACGVDGRCFAKNDNPINGFTGSVTLNILNLVTQSMISSPALTPVVNVSLPRGANAFQWFCFDGSTNAGACKPIASTLATLASQNLCAANGTDCVFWATVADGSGAVATSNFMPLVSGSLTLGDMAVPWSRVTASIGTPAPDGSSVPISLFSTGPALYVTLTTLAQGRFSNNAFFIPGQAAGASRVTINFIPVAGVSLADQLPILQETLRLEHLAMYLTQGQP